MPIWFEFDECGDDAVNCYFRAEGHCQNPRHRPEGWVAPVVVKREAR